MCSGALRHRTRRSPAEVADQPSDPRRCQLRHGVVGSQQGSRTVGMASWVMPGSSTGTNLSKRAPGITEDFLSDQVGLELHPATLAGLVRGVA